MTRWIDHTTKCKREGCFKCNVYSPSGFCKEHAPPKECDKWGCGEFFTDGNSRSKYCPKHRKKSERLPPAEGWEGHAI